MPHHEKNDLMIIGIGVDILSIEKVGSLWRDHRLRMADVVFTSEELQNLKSSKGATRREAAYLAKLFAVKEATIKALGIVGSVRYELSDIEVTGGKSPAIRLSGALRRHAMRKNMRRFLGSCSSEKEFAIAFVIGTQGDE